jgi:hypothetical protein
MFHITRLEPGEYTIYLPFPEVTIPNSVMAASQAADGAGPSERERFRNAIGDSGAPEFYSTGFQLGEFTLMRKSTAYGAEGAIGPMLTTPPPDQTGNLLVYPQTYFPGVTSLREATTFLVQSGEDRTSDMQVRLTPSARVSGHVMGPDGAVPTVGVRLIAPGGGEIANENVAEVAATITDANGAFTLLGVPVGQYTLKVTRVPLNQRPTMSTSVSVGGMTMFSSAPDTQPPLPIPDTPTLASSLPLIVSESGVSDVTLTLRAGPRVSGHIEYAGSASPLTADQLLRATITLEPIDGRTNEVGASARGQFDASGRFTTFGVVPGKYVLRLGGNLGPWMLESAIAGGRDITDVPLTIDVANVGDVVIKVTDRPASLSGTVRGSAGPDPNAVVLMFPTAREQWTNVGVTPRRLRAERVSPQGSFTIANVPAGDYFVVAIDDRVAANWQDPRRLDALSVLGTRVLIHPGEQRALDLATEAVR